MRKVGDMNCDRHIKILRITLIELVVDTYWPIQESTLTGDIALLKVLDDSQSALIAGRVLACRDQCVTDIVGLAN
jgi:hypothetical protein